MNQNSKLFESFEISDQAKTINELLSAKIRVEINQTNGKIPFSKFMQMALYESKLGYYQNNLHKFGEKGDFITAPEMGKNFAKCIANSISPFFQQSPDHLDHSVHIEQQKSILEIGAGSGALAVNLLSELAELSALPEQYWILEPSASLQNMQQIKLKESLPDYFPYVKWVSKLPENMTGIIIANEVVDAIPCERIKRQNNQWHQLGVTYKNAQFEQCMTKLVDDSELPKILTQRESSKNYSDGYHAEYRPLVNGWIKSLAKTLHQGAIILLDYGYSESELYHPQREQGSLSCFINHHTHSEPFQFVGLQDITAHVDFTQIARVAYENSLVISGYTTQAGFLLENGITEISEVFEENETPQQRYQRSQELQKLLMPGQMGEVIKVILLSKELNVGIKGFTLQDHLHRL